MRCNAQACRSWICLAIQPEKDRLVDHLIHVGRDALNIDHTARGLVRDRENLYSILVNCGWAGKSEASYAQKAQHPGTTARRTSDCGYQHNTADIVDASRTMRYS
jgi:hypothetical protein